METILEEIDHSSGTTLDYVSLDSQDENANKTKTKSTAKTDWKIIKPQSKDGLYHKIFHSPSIEMAVQFWVDSYEINNETAICELMQLFIDLSNYQNFNVAEFMDSNELDDLVHVLENFPNPAYKDSGKYLLMMRSKVYEKYHKLIADFMIALIMSCEKNEILYDNRMIPYSTTLLKYMSASKYRAVRHTGVFLGLKYITGLVIIVKDIYETATEIKREILEAKERSEDTTELEEKNMNIKHYYKRINKVVHFLYENIFKKNWNLRDNVLSSMRSDCILEIKQWIKYLPEKFLNNDVIPITLQAITDDNKTVRYSALQILMYVLDDEKNKHYSQIKNNMKKIIIIIGGRILDKDLKIAVYAIDILSLIDRYHKSLNQDMGDRVLIQIYSKYYVLATAAGRYLIQKMQKISPNDTDLLYNLVKFQIFSENEHKTGEARRPLLVEAVIGYHPVFYDIDAYIHIFKHNELDALENSVLVDIFCESLVILTTGMGSIPREKSVKRAIDKQQIKTVLTNILPELMTLAEYFQTEKLKSVLAMLQKFNIINPSSKQGSEENLTQ